MVTIDNTRCTGCGVCAQICHENCITVVEKSVAIDYELCSTCSQCIAVCPARALSWDGLEPIPFDPGKLPSAEQMAELFGERRTIRSFKNEKLDRSLLTEIAAFGAQAPTHNFHFRTIIVDDDALLGAMDAAALRFSRRIYYWIFKNPLIKALSHLSGAAMRQELVRGRPKLEHSLREGLAYSSPPPAVILVVGDKRVPLSLESAQYALYTMNLYAMTRGVACRNLVGNQMIFNRNKALRGRLGIARGEKIFAMMAVGRPAIRFRNKVKGKTLKVSWNGE